MSWVTPLTSPRLKPWKNAPMPRARPSEYTDVAHDEVPRLVAGIDLAVQVLPGAGGGEEGPLVGVAANGRADGDELAQAAELLEVRGDAGHAVRPLGLGLLLQAVDGGVTALG